MKVSQVDVFILNYNGAEYVAPCVSSILSALAVSRYHCALSVIDNRSTDDSVPMIRSLYPSVSVIERVKNRVLCAFNDIVAQSSADVVILLNNDIKADPGFVDPLISIFEENENVFLVAAKSLFPNGPYEGGRSLPFISFGLFGTTCIFRGFERLIETPGFTFAAGFGAFDRQKFLGLGGYDDLYLPGRLEDADIAFRAWRKGWKSYYQPKSVLYHLGAKSFKDRFGTRGTMELAHRNTFLFMWKNISTPKYWFAHFIFFLPRMLWMLLRGHFEWATGFYKALWKLRLALDKRRQEKQIPYPYSDEEVISFFKYGN